MLFHILFFLCEAPETYTTQVHLSGGFDQNFSFLPEDMEDYAAKYQNVTCIGSDKNHSLKKI